MAVPKLPWRTALRVLLACVLLLRTTALPATPPDFVPWHADHHMHVRSRAVYEASVALCAGKPGCQVPDPGHAVVGAADVVAALDEAHVGKGVVLSSAYLFGSPYLGDQHYDVARMTRAENEYVAAQVAQVPDRLVGFFSVDPLSASAAAEARYWAGNGRLQGLKLHFTAAGVHLKDPAQVKRIAGIVRLAGDRRLPMVIHLRASWDFGAEDTEIFIRDILPAARESTVQVAHAGGWSGTDRVMLDDLAAFAAHIARDDPATRHVLFDLSGVVTPATTPEEAAALVALMRRIGLARFVMGSDYDFPTPRATDDLTREKLPLSGQEWQTLARSCAPWAC
jgi:predicted TIM-barrel fold metal-dependent hydrolase